MTAETPSDVLLESTQVIRMLKNGENLADFDVQQGYDEQPEGTQDDGQKLLSRLPGSL